MSCLVHTHSPAAVFCCSLVTTNRAALTLALFFVEGSSASEPPSSLSYGPACDLGNRPKCSSSSESDKHRREGKGWRCFNSVNTARTRKIDMLVTSSIAICVCLSLRGSTHNRALICLVSPLLPLGVVALPSFRRTAVAGVGPPIERLEVRVPVDPPDDCRLVSTFGFPNFVEDMIRLVEHRSLVGLCGQVWLWLDGGRAARPDRTIWLVFTRFAHVFLGGRGYLLNVIAYSHETCKIILTYAYPVQSRRGSSSSFAACSYSTLDK